MINLKFRRLFLSACLLSTSSFAEDEWNIKNPVIIKSIPYEMRIDNQLGEMAKSCVGKIIIQFWVLSAPP